jgi:hypothetical protein
MKEGRGVLKDTGTIGEDQGQIMQDIAPPSRRDRELGPRYMRADDAGGRRVHVYTTCCDVGCLSYRTGIPFGADCS